MIHEEGSNVLQTKIKTQTLREASLPSCHQRPTCLYPSRALGELRSVGAAHSHRNGRPRTAQDARHTWSSETVGIQAWEGGVGLLKLFTNYIFFLQVVRSLLGLPPSCPGTQTRRPTLGHPGTGTPVHMVASSLSTLAMAWIPSHICTAKEKACNFHGI